MPDANRPQQEEESFVHQHLRVLAQELLKGYEGAVARMMYHPQLGMVTTAEAKFAGQHGWDNRR